jgi:hypothetical protein
MDELSEELCCAICLEQLSNPKALPCLHSFCEQCLETLTHGRAEPYSCPSCRKQFTLPQGRVSNLPSNFHLSSIIERVQSGVFTPQHRVPLEPHQLDTKYPNEWINRRFTNIEVSNLGTAQISFCSFIFMFNSHSLLLFYFRNSSCWKTWRKWKCRA